MNSLPDPDFDTTPFDTEPDGPSKPVRYQTITVILPDDARPLRPFDVIKLALDSSPDSLTWYPVTAAGSARDTA